MIAELALAVAFSATTPVVAPEARAPHLPRVHAELVIDRGTWNGSGDVGIPAWAVPGEGRIYLRPETRRAALGLCGARARALGRFILWHEAGHASGIIDEDGANAFAYQHVGRRLERLLPAYGTLLTTWRELRLACTGGGKP